MNATEIEAIVARILAGLEAASAGAGTDEGIGRHPIPIESSARHVHLTAEAAVRLFGPKAQLDNKRNLSQPGEFLAEQRVKLVSGKGEIANVAVLGPLRSAVQVELSCTDCRALGLEAPLRLSGDLRDAADVYIVGDCGMIEARGSVIVAQSHLHLRPQDAEAYGVRDGQLVRVAVESTRPLTFSGVVVRVRADFAPACHIDFDEANACLLTAASKAYLLSGDAVRSCRAPQAQATTVQPLCCTEPLITEALARELAAACPEKVLQIKRGVIITPAAKDVLNAAKLTIAMVKA